MPRPLVTLFCCFKTKQNTTIERLHLISTGYFGRQNILHLQIRQQVLVWENGTWFLHLRNPHRMKCLRVGGVVSVLY